MCVGVPDHPLVEDQTKDISTDVKLSIRRLQLNTKKQIICNCFYSLLSSIPGAGNQPCCFFSSLCCGFDVKVCKTVVNGWKVFVPLLALKDAKVTFKLGQPYKYKKDSNRH